MNDTLIITDENVYPKIYRQDILNECKKELSYYNEEKLSFLELRKLYKIKMIARFFLYVGCYVLSPTKSQITVCEKYRLSGRDMETKFFDEIRSKYFPISGFVIG